MLYKIHQAAVLALGLALLSGCATPVETAPATLTTAHAANMSLAASAHIVLATGYERTLAPGSRWRRVGSLPEGDVYRPIDTVFTIEGRQVHEAYLIVSPTRQLVGFYLPGEANLSRLPKPIPLSLREEP